MKLKSVGVIALVLGVLVIGQVFINTQSNISKENLQNKLCKKVDEMFSVDKYIERVKSLNILSDEEMKQFAYVERKIVELSDEINVLNDKEAIKQKEKELEELQKSIAYLYEKISDSVGGEFEVSMSGELIAEHLKYVARLGVLSEEEFDRYANVKVKIEESSLSEKEVEKLYESINDISLKIQNKKEK